MKNFLHTAIVFSVALLLFGCDSSSKSKPPAAVGHSSGKLSIATTFYPTQYFAQRIGGELVDVTCPVPVDEDPIFWMPNASAIQQYQSADLIVLNGAGFAKWIDKVSLPQSRILDTALPLEPELIKFEGVVEHSHGKEGSHSHEGIDGHTWVDPLNAKVQASEVRNALILRLPDAHEILEANYQGLVADLDTLDQQFKKIASAGMPALFGSHPAYNYIARRYDWNIDNLDLDPAVMPSTEVIAAIATRQKAHTAKWLLWESQPAADVSERLETELGLKSILFSPCELLPSADQAAGADYLSIMRANADRLAGVVE